jgi:hypothetical protein
MNKIGINGEKIEKKNRGGMKDIEKAGVAKIRDEAVENGGTTEKF